MKGKKGLKAQSPLKGSHTKKMSKAVFKPSDALTVTNPETGTRYRWLNKAKFERAGGANPYGWEVVNTITGTNEDKEVSKSFLNSSNSIDGTRRSGDLILAKMPEDMAQARNAYYKNRQKQKEEVVHAKKKLGEHGSLNFESRRGRDVEKYDYE